MNFRRITTELHRDLGYFLSGLILVYCISGIALNHVNDWNPDFSLHKKKVSFGGPCKREEMTAQRIAEFSALVGESAPKLHDFPTESHVKIYYENASLLVDLETGTGLYERVQRRPLFYQTNLIHRNSLKGWKWASDAFGLLLIFVTVSGWFILKGRYGLGGRGKWFIVAGIVPPVLAVVLFEFLAAR